METKASMNMKTGTLVSASLKSTVAREVALHYFEKSTQPIDADDVLAHLREHELKTDRATVYRILEVFYEKGIIDRLEFQEGKFRYELAGRTDHHHLVCEKCGKIEDISDCSIGSLEKEIGEKKGFNVKRHSLEFYGVCKSCQK